MLDKLASSRRGGLTPRRVAAALGRRLRAVPEALAYRLQSGPGSENYRRLAACRNRHAGQRCFILGNGPSLARTDLKRISGDFSFGLNRIYLLFDDTPFRPAYHVCMNDLVLQQSAREIAELEMPRFVNWRQQNLFAEDPRNHFLRETYWPQFSRDLTAGVWGGATVTFVALQIAYYMGFQRVILVGVDHHFVSNGTPHKTTRSTGGDTNHFRPDYFPAGYRWQLPDLETSELAYRLARSAFEADGRSVVDATLGGRLQVFPKVDYETVTA